jgi:hypothetical protein
MSGCSDESDTPPVSEAPHLDFRTSGTYDFSEYLFPVESQFNNYRDKSYLDDTGSRNYTDYNETFYSLWYENNGTAIQEYRDGSLKGKYLILEDRIKAVTDENSTRSYVRFLEEKQYVVLQEIPGEGDEGLDTSTDMCQITKHEERRVVAGNTYEDVLVMQCQSNSTKHDVLAETEIETVTDTDYTAYLAKDIGMIESIHDSCTSNTFGTLSEKKCKKIVTELTTYN